MHNDSWMVKGQALEAYLNACKNADLSNFKQDTRLTKIFEHCSREIGYCYLRAIYEDNYKLFLNNFTNDTIGNPIVYQYDLMGRFSPSTLQYIGVLSNLIKHFGSLDGLRILEIGGGYGGQARTIMDVYKPSAYHIIDLPEVCGLQMRYLKEFECVDCFTQPTGQQYDLVISNYALSEIVQNEEYVEMCRNIPHGYITCNTDLVQFPFDTKRSPDIEGEKKENYILVW